MIDQTNLPPCPDCRRDLTEEKVIRLGLSDEQPGSRNKVVMRCESCDSRYLWHEWISSFDFTSYCHEYSSELRRLNPEEYTEELIELRLPFRADTRMCR